MGITDWVSWTGTQDRLTRLMPSSTTRTFQPIQAISAKKKITSTSESAASGRRIDGGSESSRPSKPI